MQRLCMLFHASNLNFEGRKHLCKYGKLGIHTSSDNKKYQTKVTKFFGRNNKK